MTEHDFATLVYPHAKPVKLPILIVLAETTITVLIDTVACEPVSRDDLVTYGHQDVWSSITLIFCFELLYV